jgi:cysteine desulfurase family protein
VSSIDYNDVVYLDNAATTFPKPRSVLMSAFECISEYCANPGRSVHRYALKTSERIYEAREKLSEYLGIDSPERIVFTSNATHSLNIAIQGCIDHKCHIITSDLEHNSVIRPLFEASQRYGVEVSEFNSDLDLEDSVSEIIRPDTEYLITTLQSNVTGKVISPLEILSVARKYNLKTIVDASQYLGHHRIDLSQYKFDILCAPGHKGLFGLQGAGILVINGNINPKPIMFGGSGSNSVDPAMPDYIPDRYEAGTLNSPSIISLLSGVEYLLALGEEYICYRIKLLTDRLNEVLLSSGVSVYGCESGIACFKVEGVPSSRISALLDNDGIATRSGLHCAPSAHKKLGTTENGLVRVSLSIHNTISDLDRLYKSLMGIKKEYIG